LRELTTGTLLRRAGAEVIGTALLLVAVVGSGIAAQRLSPSDAGLQLLENALATGAALTAIIVAVGPVSGAHLNPVVSLVDAAFGGLRRRELGVYVCAQLVGATFGVMVANLMFSLPAVTVSAHARSSMGIWLGEVIATLGLLLVIFGAVRSNRAAVVPFAVGAYITGAYFFTSSTSFANPAVTVARELSNTFAGISPGSVLPFLGAELVGAGLGWLAISGLYPRAREVADVVLLPHGRSYRRLRSDSRPTGIGQRSQLTDWRILRHLQSRDGPRVPGRIVRAASRDGQSRRVPRRVCRAVRSRASSS
jgi:glycerol uptake facilitator-like aquaporin